MIVEKMPHWIREVGDSIAAMSIALGVTIKTSDFFNLFTIVPSWREVAMNNIALLTALFTLVWVFFRAVDTVMEKRKQFIEWRKKSKDNAINN